MGACGCSFSERLGWGGEVEIVEIEIGCSGHSYMVSMTSLNHHATQKWGAKQEGNSGKRGMVERSCNT